MKHYDFVDMIVLLLLIILALIAAAGLVMVLDIALDKGEAAECAKWTEQAHEYENYYLLEWQYDQCEAVERPLPAGYLRAE